MMNEHADEPHHMRVFPVQRQRRLNTIAIRVRNLSPSVMLAKAGMTIKADLAQP